MITIELPTSIELTPALISVALTILGIILGFIIWLVKLREKTNQNDEKIKDIKDDYKEIEKRLRDVESKLIVASLARSIDDYIEAKLNAYNLSKSKLNNIGDKK